jgi:transcriptional regulator with PAS, ATPase and Fis domain
LDITQVEPEPEDEESAGEGRATLEDVEREHILASLDRHRGNRAATATELGISVRTLYYRLAEFQRQGYLP